MQKGLLYLLVHFAIAAQGSFLFAGEAPAYPGSSFTPSLFLGDTTLVSCEQAPTAYGTWINTAQLQVTTQYSGDSIVLDPVPQPGYSFSGPCGDTLRQQFFIYQPGTTNLKATELFVFITLDTTPPAFSSPFPDTIRLGCTAPLPDSTLVQVTDNCLLDTFSIVTQIAIDGNCPYSKTITRTWTASDECGNQSQYVQVILYSDTEGPEFTSFPNDTTISCTGDFSVAILGTPSITDSCDANPLLTFFDQVVPNSNPACKSSFEIRRRWQARDACGNSRFRTQTIKVVDDQAPTFVAPRDTVISCVFGDDPFFTGVPSQLIDNCDTLDSSNFRYEDVLIADSCDNAYSVQRTWYVFDNCGNVDSAVQRIDVIDDRAPVFTTVPTNLILSCSPGQDYRQLFQDWIDSRAGAVAADNCTPDNRLQWSVLNAGTSEAATFPDLACREGAPALYFRQIDVVVRDECGLSDTATVTFSVTDDTPPLITSCPTDTVLSTDPGLCTVAFTLVPPAVTENCTVIDGQYRLAYGYRLNNNTPVAMDTLRPETILLPQGVNRITYYIQDCGGAIDSCTYLVEVNDTEAPRIGCPADLEIVLGQGLCQADVTLPAPAFLTDNCDNFSNDFSQIEYFLEGATSLNPVQPHTAASPVVTLAQGITFVSYVVRDAAGNADTCTFRITIRDNEAPVARCQPTTLFINPSGLQNETVSVVEIDAGTSDNCRLDTMYLSPFTFSCAQAGSVQTITLTAVDQSGNMAQCSTIVRIETLEPQPSANSGLCGSDTLFLRANPPPATGGIVFTYLWSGPNGFTSTKENPVIPNISSANAGSYRVEITGITGCKAAGTIEVAIEDLPLTPTIQGNRNYCIDETIMLSSSVTATGNQVSYNWYAGNPPSGQLVARTIVPDWTIPGPHPAGTATYYLEIEADGCTSRPSAAVQITANEIPVAIPLDTVINICEGEDITLGTQVSGPGITYAWSGPNGFSSTRQFPTSIESARTVNGGVYTLQVFRNGCPSEPAFVRVNVRPQPARPEISNNGPVCAGSSLTLTTNAYATIYNWVRPDLSVVSSATRSFTVSSITSGQGGPWRVYVTSFGCDSEWSAPTNVVVNELPATAAATLPAVVCEGSAMTLSASPEIANATYRWTGPNGFMAVGRSVPVENVQASNSGTYTLRITTPAGCANEDAINVDVKEGVRIVAVSNNGPACLSGPTDIKLTGAVFPADDGSYSYRWAGPNGFMAATREATIPNATAQNNGNYSLVVETAEGCRSPVASTLVDVADPPPTPGIPMASAGTPAPFCTDDRIVLFTNAYEGSEVAYNWLTPGAGLVVTDNPSLSINGANTDDSGEYSVFVTVDGCSSRPSPAFQMTVNARPNALATSNGPVCAGLPIELRANTVSGGQYLWSGPNFTSSLPNPVIPVADSAEHAGAYSLVVSRNGCSSDTAYAEVVVDPAPEQPRLLTSGQVCMSDPDARLRLALSPGTETDNATYRWFGPGGLIGQTSVPSLDITDFSGYQDGSFAFSVEAVLGACPSERSETIQVSLNRIPANTAFAGNDYTVCETAGINLNAASPSLGAGMWTLIAPDTATGVSIANPDRANTAVANLRGGVAYTFRWTLSNGACRNYSFDDIRIQVERSETAFAGRDTVVCLSRDIRLDALPATSGSGRWSQSSVQELLGVDIVNVADPQTLIEGLQPGNLYAFTWTVTSGCGAVADEVLVLVSDPSPFAGVDQIVCNDLGTAFLEADRPTDGSLGRWIAPGLAIEEVNNPQSMISGLAEGINTIVWEVDEGICGNDSRDTVLIEYKRNPVAEDDAVEVPFGEATEFNVLINDSVPAGSFVNIVQAPAHGAVVPLTNGTFRYDPDFNFYGTDRMLYEVCSEACECSMAAVDFRVGDNAACDVPTVITPNDDGINDIFVIPCFFDAATYPNSQLIIFNRWGDEVYRSVRPYPNNWNGRYNGEPVPVGTYYYIIDLGNGQEPQTGFFMIQR